MKIKEEEDAMENRSSSASFSSNLSPSLQGTNFQRIFQRLHFSKTITSNALQNFREARKKCTVPFNC